MCTQFSQTLIKPQLYPVIFINHSQNSNGEWPCIHDILCITETRSRKHWCVYMMMKVARQGTGSCSSSVAQLCPTLCNPIDCSMPGFPVHYELPDLLKLMFIELVMPSNHLILCHPLLLLPSIFPCIRIFSNESFLLIRWPKYWNCGIIISPSNEYSGLISFRID